MIFYDNDSANKKTGRAATNEFIIDGTTNILVDDGVDTLDFITLPGEYLIQISDGKIAKILVDETTAIKIAGNALFTITVTTDTKVNVYVDSGALKVENKTGASVIYTIAKTGVA